MIAHQPGLTVGAFWNNPTETFVDVTQVHEKELLTGVGWVLCLNLNSEPHCCSTRLIEDTSLTG
jgi:hypothetical protein